MGRDIANIIASCRALGKRIGILLSDIAGFIVIINIRLARNGVLFTGELTERIIGVFVYYYAVFFNLDNVAQIIVGIGIYS